MRVPVASFSLFSFLNALEPRWPMEALPNPALEDLLSDGGSGLFSKRVGLLVSEMSLSGIAETLVFSVGFRIDHPRVGRSDGTRDRAPNADLPSADRPSADLPKVDPPSPFWLCARLVWKLTENGERGARVARDGGGDAITSSLKLASADAGYGKMQSRIACSSLGVRR